MKFRLFTSLPVYVILYKNRAKVYRLDSGKSIDRVSTKPISNSRLLWGDYQQGEVFIKKILSDLLNGNYYLVSPPFRMLIHQIEMKEGGITFVEKRALLDSAKHMNAKEVYLCFDKDELTLKEALSKINSKEAISSVY